MATDASSSQNLSGAKSKLGGSRGSLLKTLDKEIAAQSRAAERPYLKAIDKVVKASDWASTEVTDNILGRLQVILNDAKSANPQGLNAATSQVNHIKSMLKAIPDKSERQKVRNLLMTSEKVLKNDLSQKRSWKAKTGRFVGDFIKEHSLDVAGVLGAITAQSPLALMAGNFIQNRLTAGREQRAKAKEESLEYLRGVREDLDPRYTDSPMYRRRLGLVASKHTGMFDWGRAQERTASMDFPMTRRVVKSGDGSRTLTELRHHTGFLKDIKVSTKKTADTVTKLLAVSQRTIPNAYTTAENAEESLGAGSTKGGLSKLSTAGRKFLGAAGGSVMSRISQWGSTITDFLEAGAYLSLVIPGIGKFIKGIKPWLGKFGKLLFTKVNFGAFGSFFSKSVLSSFSGFGRVFSSSIGKFMGSIIPKVLGAVVAPVIDAVEGFGQRGAWGTSGTSSVLGGILGGASSSPWMNILFGAMKGFAVGGPIGALAGAILGGVGGQRIAKGLDWIGKKSLQGLGLLQKYLVNPFVSLVHWSAGVGSKVVKSVKNTWSGFIDTAKSLVSRVTNIDIWSIAKNFLSARAYKAFTWIFGTGDKTPAPKTLIPQTSSQTGRPVGGIEVPRAAPHASMSQRRDAARARHMRRPEAMLDRAIVDVAPMSSDQAPGGFDYQAYAEALGNRESNSDYLRVNSLGYLGKYQFGASALESVGLLKPGASKHGTVRSILNDPSNWTIAGGKETFLNSPEMQEEAMRKFTAQNFRELERRGIISSSSSAADRAGALSEAHLLGVGKMSQNRAGGTDSTDAYGTSGQTYRTLGAKSQMAYNVQKSDQASRISSDTKSVQEARIAANQSRGNQTIVNAPQTNIQNGGSGSGTPASTRNPESTIDSINERNYTPAVVFG